MVHMLCGKWPEPQTGPIRTEGGRLIPISEAERREEFLLIIGKEYPLMDLIKSCIHNDPQMRPCAEQVVRRMEFQVQQYPASFNNRLDMLKRIKRDE